MASTLGSLFSLRGARAAIRQRSQRCAKRRSRLKLELQARIVGTNPDRAVHPLSVGTQRAFPHERIVDPDPQAGLMEFGVQRVRVSGLKHWDGGGMKRLDIAVSPVAALRAGGLPG